MSDFTTITAKSLVSFDGQSGHGGDGQFGQYRAPRASDIIEPGTEAERPEITRDRHLELLLWLMNLELRLPPYEA